MDDKAEKKCRLIGERKGEGKEVKSQDMFSTVACEIRRYISVHSSKLRTGASFEGLQREKLDSGQAGNIPTSVLRN